MLLQKPSVEARISLQTERIASATNRISRLRPSIAADKEQLEILLIEIANAALAAADWAEEIAKGGQR